jgi:serine/threonine protein kinase
MSHKGSRKRPQAECKSSDITSSKNSRRITVEKDDHFQLTPETRVLKDGRYTIENLIGKGTFGKVFIAWDSKYQERVALKIVRDVPKYYESACVEAHILRNIYKQMKESGQNPKLCMKLYSTFEVNRHLVFVTELLGESLYQVIKLNAHHGFPLQVARIIAQQILHAVSFLHNKMALIHTDLKLENIVFVTRGDFIQRPVIYHKHGVESLVRINIPRDFRIKLIDFGGGTYYVGEKRTRVVNTRQYRSPEVILGLGWERPADLWSVGCILAELYTGDLLFATHNDLEHLGLMERLLEPWKFNSLMCSGNEKLVLNSSRRDGKRGSPDSTSKAGEEVDAFDQNVDAHYGKIEGYEEEGKVFDVNIASLSSGSYDYVKKQMNIMDVLFSVRGGEEGLDGYVRLIRNLLHVDPRKRYTPTRGLRSRTFKGRDYDKGGEGNFLEL